jgi:hypothetical protein
MPKPREVELEVELDPKPTPQVEDPSLEGDEELEYQVLMPGDEDVEDETPQEPEDPSAQELAALRAQLAQRESEGSTVAQGFAQLAETLKGIQSPQAPKTPPPIDIEKMNSELKEKMYDNPLEAMGQFYSTFVTPQISAVEARAKELDLKNERLDTALENPDLFKNYGAEIDETVKALGNAPGSYRKALSIVKGNHIDDIVEQKIQEALAKAAPPKAPSYTGVRDMPVANPGTKKPVVRLTQDDLREIELSPFTRDEWIRRYKMSK